MTDKAAPGPWHTFRLPYLTEIMNGLGPFDPRETVIITKGSSMGLTEVLLKAPIPKA